MPFSVEGNRGGQSSTQTPFHDDTTCDDRGSDLGTMMPDESSMSPKFAVSS
jgi:hypothetical protein